jgi:hypothetical protein
VSGLLNHLYSPVRQKFAGKARPSGNAGAKVKSEPDAVTLKSKTIVPDIDQPLYRWTETDPDGTRLRKAIPNRLRHGNMNDRYYLVDPAVSEPLMINTPEKLSPPNFKRIQKICKQLALFILPLADPQAHSQTVNGVRIPWLRKQYTGQDLLKILGKPINQRDQNLITYFTSIGSAYKQIYSNFWWLRDSETVAYAFSHNQHADPQKRKLDLMLF